MIAVACLVVAIFFTVVAFVFIAQADNLQRQLDRKESYLRAANEINSELRNSLEKLDRAIHEKDCMIAALRTTLSDAVDPDPDDCRRV
jgi:peptidoglycan hydrolase CwlO-like protein